MSRLLGSRFSVFPEGSDWAYLDIVHIISAAEEAGYSTYWQQDNIMGHAPMPRDAAIHDPWVLLPALAQATDTIDVGTLVTPILRRYAPLLAKSSASLDDISGGRLILGLGAGDDTLQYTAFGQEFWPARERVEMLREAVEVISKLWTGGPADHQGTWYQLAGATCHPRPVQEPRPPIVIGVNTSKRRLPALSAEVADGMVCMWGADDRVAMQADVYRKRREELNMGPGWLGRKVSMLFCPDTNIDDARFRRMLMDIAGFDYDTSEYGSEGEVPEGVYPDAWIIGPPERAAEEIHRRTFAMGFDHVVFDFFAHGLGLQTDGIDGWAGNFLGAMRVFEAEVRPELEALIESR
jgi:alkanesulfonate monooxygenase SsuD/methylene tetrahydromethanopterin reductase-like flavin-dependent oxidoreductase (luciferase family)